VLLEPNQNQKLKSKNEQLKPKTKRQIAGEAAIHRAERGPYPHERPFRRKPANRPSTCDA
jgi:hypothetical protein